MSRHFVSSYIVPTGTKSYIMYNIVHILTRNEAGLSRRNRSLHIHHFLYLSMSVLWCIIKNK